MTWAERSRLDELREAVRRSDAGGDSHAIPPDRPPIEFEADGKAPTWTPEADETITDPAPLVYERFPIECLPGPMRELVIQGAKAAQVDPATLALPALGAVASAIGNARTIRLSSGWAEPSILWAVVVLPSGSVKSAAVELAVAPVGKHDDDLFRLWQEERETYLVELAIYEKALAKWKRSADAGDPPIAPEPPVCERAIVDDITFESLCSTLADSPRGLLLATDELSGWLGSFTRYAGPNRTGAEEARWLKLHRAQALKIDRKKAEPIRIPKAALSIVGMVQPGVLQSAIRETDFSSGLVARILWACPPTPKKTWAGARGGLSPATEGAYLSMVEKLFTLELDTDDETGEPTPRALGMDDDAEKVWGRHYDAINGRMAGESDNERAMLSKLEGGAARLALVIHLGRWAAGENVSPDAVDIESMRRGVELAQWFAHEAERLYASLDGEGVDSETARLVEWVRGRGGSVTVRQLVKTGRREFRNDSAKAEAALDALDGVFGHWEHPAQNGPGAPKARVFVIDDTALAPTIPSDEPESAIAGAGATGATAGNNGANGPP